MEPWVQEVAAAVAQRATGDLRTLVDISSPSGDRAGAEQAIIAAQALAPPEATVQRLPCSSPDHADDLLLELRGTGRARVLLLGHLDTVVGHADHRPLTQDGETLVGSGTIDMKGGDVIALGLLRALAAQSDRFAETALLLVVDEEWRTSGLAHVSRFAGFDACLCFEGGQRGPDGQDSVVVRRKAAGTLRVTGRGVAAHSGSAPDRGANALLALAKAAQVVAARHDPHGDHALTAVPTVLRSGESFNVVPDAGELLCDLRAHDHTVFDMVREAVPTAVDGATLDAQLIRVWPGMDSREATAAVIAAAAAALGRDVVAGGRGGASDASHFAPAIPVTIDGLGPLGGAAHNPAEHALTASFEPRTQLAAAVLHAVLDPR
jgi:glutamate carboxypeptidase